MDYVVVTMEVTEVEWYDLSVAKKSSVVFRGVWNSPFISSSYLIQKEVLPMIKEAYAPRPFDVDMNFCKFLRIKVCHTLPESPPSGNSTVIPCPVMMASHSMISSRGGLSGLFQ